MMTRQSVKPAYRYSIEMRAILLCSGFVMLLTALSMRLIFLQHTQHDEVMLGMKEADLTPEIVPARRGDILDRDRRPLATTEPVSKIMFDTYHVPSRNAVHGLAGKYLGMGKEELLGYGEKEAYGPLYYKMLASQLARPLKCDEQDLFRRLKSSNSDVTIQKGVDSQLSRDLVNGLKDDGFLGLSYHDTVKRVYVSEELACHVLGYVYHGTKGAEGIEASMDSFLRGKDGARYYSGGQLVEEELSENGSHVVLTIDAAFQGMAEKIVDKHYKALRPKGITAIFADPSSGEILALVNRPGFRPADGGNADPRTRWNMGVSGTYEPGSTFKIVTLGAALDQRLVGLDTWVDCHDGYYREDGWEKALEDSAEARSSASVRDVLASSLNTGNYSVARQLNSKVYYDYMLKFGLGQKTGIRLPAEGNTRVPHPVRGEKSNANDGWGRSTMSLSRLGMGYNLTATPLQVLGFMSVVCNEGNLIRPRMVREILTETYQVSARLDSEVVENVFSPRTAGLLKNALIHAVKEGTGVNAAVDGYIVGGKTGTTMKVINGHYRKNRNLTSFVGFIGTESEPALIGMVLVDDPQNEGKRHGGTVAAPIFQEIAEAGMYHFGVRRLASANVEMAN